MFTFSAVAIVFLILALDSLMTNIIIKKAKKKRNNREHVMPKEQLKFHWCAWEVCAVEVRAASMINDQ